MTPIPMTTDTTDQVLINLAFEFPWQTTSWYAEAVGLPLGNTRRMLTRLRRAGHITGRMLNSGTPFAHWIWAGADRRGLAVRRGIVAFEVVWTQ